MWQIFEVDSNLEWLKSIPKHISEIYLGALYKNGVINEIHNDFKIKWVKMKKKRMLVKSEHVGVWGWNSWCGIHTFPMLLGKNATEAYKKTVDVGFNALEPKTNLLPHAVLHKDGVFASEPTYKCYDGIHGEGYNVCNMICWAKMAMEYFLISQDKEWFNIEKLKVITNTIDYLLNNQRQKYNPALLYVGIEGDWTENTNYELDNSNSTVNLLKTMQLAMECQKVLKDPCTKLDYAEIYNEILDNFNAPVEMGGFWSDKLGFYIHSNDGKGENIHGDKYFESTVNYFAILWDIAPKEYQERIWEFLKINRNKIEQPYPVLTNYLPKTGARRSNYGKTVTDGDIWMVLGGHASAARLKNGYIKEGTEMFKSIIDYEKEHGVIHNALYPESGKTNDSWDPEVANYGAPYAPFVLGLLGLEYSAEGPILNIKSLEGLTNLIIKIYIFGQPYEIKINWDSQKVPKIEVKYLGNEDGFNDKFEVNESRVVFIKN